MKTPKDRAEKLLEAIFSKVERIEGLVEKAAATRSSTISQASPGNSELSEIKRYFRCYRLHCSHHRVAFPKNGKTQQPEQFKD